MWEICFQLIIHSLNLLEFESFQTQAIYDLSRSERDYLVIF